MSHHTIAFVEDYLHHVRKVCELFETQLGATMPRQAYRSGRIPAHGVLGDEGSIEYRFHGNGCEVFFGDVLVDFDFGPGDRVDGFDQWRLSRFVKSRADEYPELQNPVALKRAFGALKSAGLIVCPRWSPGPHLSYFAHAIEEAAAAV